MTLFLSLLPIYLFGNLHCIGMCGPLVMMIGRHRFRYFYFLGRTLSFSLAGLIAGGVGSVLGVIFQEYFIGAFISFICGLVIFAIGSCYIFNWNFPYMKILAKKIAPFNNKLSLLILKDRPLATFLFGFFTIFLPCGQTIIVFSACALYGSGFVGLINGLFFALLTSPALYISMQTHRLFFKARQNYHILIGVSAVIVGTLAIFRGLADLDVISHYVVNPQASPEYHLVIY